MLLTETESDACGKMFNVTQPRLSLDGYLTIPGTNHGQ